jgi:hypothetical protein
MTALAEPFVFLAGRPAAERATDARRLRGGLLLLLSLAIWNDDRIGGDATHGKSTGAAQPAYVSGVRLAISPMTSEGMDCSCSCHDLATVRYAGSNEVLLASFDGNPVPINPQCVAAPIRPPCIHRNHVRARVKLPSRRMSKMPFGCDRLRRRRILRRPESPDSSERYGWRDSS